MQINKDEYGRVSSIRTNIKTEDIITDEEKNRLEILFRYFVNKFIYEMELYHANDIINYANNYGIPINPILIKYKFGTAMCNLSQYSKEINISPFINIDESFNSLKFLKGFTFTRGNFSDVTVYTDHDFIFIVLTDCLKEHEVFMIWLVEQLENTFYDKDFNIPYPYAIPNHNRQSVENLYANTLFYDVNQKINRNKNKRIDSLVEDGLTIGEYINKEKIFAYIHTENQLFDICLKYGKPYNQVKKYVQNYKGRTFG